MANINKIRLSGQTYNIEDVNASKTVELTQAQYDALTVKDPNTFYVITDAQGADLSNYYTKSETSGATQISTALASKQTTLTAGTGINITDNVISATGGGGGGKAIEAGRGISVTTGETADTVSLNLPISAGTGTNSIVEGHTNNKASGSYSHAEGKGTVASGSWGSHAEGASTTASGSYSHAEGSDTKANGCYSHAEGYYTIASNNSEHANGQYNVSNKANTTFGNSGNTLFSVGNGTADNARHNAFEIRQNGDIYLTKDGQDVKLQDQLGGSSITVDTALDSGSTNPVQNKVIYNKIDEVEQVTAAGLNALNDKFDGLKLKKLTQAQYDALSGNTDSNTLYVIVN